MRKFLKLLLRYYLQILTGILSYIPIPQWQNITKLKNELGYTIHSNMDLMRSVMRKIHSQANKVIRCPFCEARFAEKLELVVHLKRRHR
jgi:hypothetical protein